MKNITPYGVFVELDENIGGMVHISDLSWIKRFQHPSEYTKVGENLDVVVLDIDHDGRKISLGHKQMEEDPWDTFESVFPVGSVHEATVLRREDKGAIVALPYGLEGFVPNRHLKKEDGKTLAEVDEVLPLKVIEFDRDDKRIVVSHTRYLRDKDKTESEKKAAEAADRKADRKAAQRKPSGATLKKVNRKVEKSTFGELDALAQLKADMEAAEKGVGAAVGAAAAKEAAEEVKEKAEEAKEKAEEMAKEATEAVAEAAEETAVAAEEVKEEATEAAAEAAEEATDAAEKAAEEATDADSEEKEEKKEDE